jgi:Flp pilus assembly protein TadB
MRQQLETISETVRHFYIILALQGVIFISLAVLILVYPAVLFALVATTFVLIGASLLVGAYKVYSFWKKLPSFMK